MMWGKVTRLASRSVPILNGVVIAATIIIEVAAIVRKARQS